MLALNLNRLHRCLTGQTAALGEHVQQQQTVVVAAAAGTVFEGRVHTDVVVTGRMVRGTVHEVPAVLQGPPAITHIGGRHRDVGGSWAARHTAHTASPSLCRAVPYSDPCSSLCRNGMGRSPRDLREAQDGGRKLMTGEQPAAHLSNVHELS